jgi:hypothetical protein
MTLSRTGIAAVAMVLVSTGCGARTELEVGRARLDAGPRDAGLSEGAAALPDATAPAGDACANGTECGATCRAGQTPCSAACVDPTSDPDNCGVCGHGCCGGVCSGGTCAPLTIASQQAGPAGVKVDATSVYWVNVVVGSGAIMRAPLRGGSATVLATAQTASAGIAVDATSVYYLADGAVRAVPLTGGAPAILASTPYNTPLGGIAVDATRVYWSSGLGRALLQIPLGGGTPTTLATAIDATGQTGGVALDGSNVYWTEPGITQSDGVVRKMPLGGGMATTLASGQRSPIAVAVDAASVYWSDETGGSVMKVALGGGSPTALASGQAVPNGIAIDGTYVYWGSDDGSLLRVALAGGSPTVIASGASAPVGVALDAACVYWTNPGTGTVMTIAKP